MSEHIFMHIDQAPSYLELATSTASLSRTRELIREGTPKKVAPKEGTPIDQR